MSNTTHYFNSKNSWSLLKDKILRHYLKPYTAKVLTTKLPITFIDCFAGKGRFDDGTKGSPLIICDNIDYFLNESSNTNSAMNAIFIEKKYFDDLRHNLANYNHCEVWEGTFEMNLDRVLKLGTNRNIFMYIDPYGIISLDFNRFKAIKDKRFNTLEMLINFNTFGFLREGCSVLKYDTIIDSFDPEEYYEDEPSNNKENMNKIACGDYWQLILNNYYNKNISMHQAEEQFTLEYIKRLKSLFKYVIDVPIKTKAKNIPKYRLLFATDKDEGLFLMCDEMNTVWKQIVNAKSDEQQSFFDCIPDLKDPATLSVENDIISLLEEYSCPINLKDFYVKMIEKNSVMFSTSQYNRILEKMEGNQIIVKRCPEFTKTGRKATSFSYRHYDIFLELNESYCLSFI